MLYCGRSSEVYFWVQILADVTGFGMKRLAKDVEAPLGDCFLAGLGTGVIDRPERIKEWLEFRSTVLPEADTASLYRDYYEIFKELYRNTAELARRLVDL